MISINKRQFLSRMFKEYYVRGLNDGSIKPPRKIENREFAFIFWNSPGMHRHVKLTKITELTNVLKNDTFQHVYLSGAYYRYPDGMSMNQKEWMGMDFLIDIDADHFMTSCKMKHDSWLCKACGREGKGPAPEKCKCGGKSFEEVNWICDECLDESKKEVIKFIDIFLSDFNISLDDISIHFSGNRGYHIIINSEEFYKINQLERREFVDYLTGIGLNLRSNGILKIGDSITGPTRESLGWGKYIYNGVVELINKCENGSLNDLNIRSDTKEKIINNKESILNELKLSRPKIKSVSANIWLKIINHVIDNIALRIDVPVSIDLHRLIRFVNSLHGKTGFKVQKIDIDELKEYDPFNEAIAFSKDIKIEVNMKECPEFRIGDKIFGPYDQSQRIELPLPAAVFAMSRNVADLI
ncbi:MAG: hypothetical protein EU549_03995 [Promethearchaeota archaeon]|nr:MAG: hypothetical protein EU549_03995 [Candidatus Lokiarchaeota archaeon]